jgi:hypothetical protein
MHPVCDTLRQCPHSISDGIRNLAQVLPANQQRSGSLLTRFFLQLQVLFALIFQEKSKYTQYQVEYQKITGKRSFFGLPSPPPWPPTRCRAWRLAFLPNPTTLRLLKKHKSESSSTWHSSPASRQRNVSSIPPETRLQKKSGPSLGAVPLHTFYMPWRATISFLISAIAFAGFKPFGQACAQFIIVWQRYKEKGSSNASKRSPVWSSRLSTIHR